ncbi:MAG: hypothetical protein JO223_06390 [Hyphomicrobiales bacterium]|nr:hypothetical protein [Hyphomicrobiales bacterium]MBV8444243.1 hypothetical protein [Hyphomicrobiales bacterium]
MPTLTLTADQVPDEFRAIPPLTQASCVTVRRKAMFALSGNAGQAQTISREQVE